jgi:hypothetical protein
MTFEASDLRFGAEACLGPNHCVFGLLPDFCIDRDIPSVLGHVRVGATMVVCAPCFEHRGKEASYARNT